MLSQFNQFLFLIDIHILNYPNLHNLSLLFCLVLPSPDNQGLTAVIEHLSCWILEPVFLDDAAVQRKNPETWTTGNRVNISWDFSNLASDLSVTIEIINLFYNQSGIEFHNYTTVVFSQPNTGKAEFDLPLMENLR